MTYRPPSLLVIGILGGIASGKSLVSRQLEKFGAHIIDADCLGHQALDDDGVQQALRQRWGHTIFSTEGNVDRRQLGKIVFSKSPGRSESLQFLESLTFPIIETLISDEIAQTSRIGSSRVIVLDAAVMIKAGWDKKCDQLMFVDTPRQIRLERALERGWTQQEFEVRERFQIPLEQKRQRADIIIDNSGSEEETGKQVEHFWHCLP